MLAIVIGHVPTQYGQVSICSVKNHLPDRPDGFAQKRNGDNSKRKRTHALQASTCMN